MPSEVLVPLFIGTIVMAARGSANVTLGWNSSPDSSVAGYNLYCGGASGNYTNKTNCGTNTVDTVSNLTSGVIYYFAATTYDANGLESAFSTEVAYPVPASPVYQPPTLNPIGNLVLSQNAGTQPVNLAGISAGSMAPGQTLLIMASSDNPGVVSNPVVNYVSGSPTATLLLTPTAVGSATITVRANNGAASNNIASQSFRVNVGTLVEQLQRAPGGQFILALNGPVGSNYVVETSTDLVHWTPFSTNAISPAGSAAVVDLNPALPRKFYRVVPYAGSSTPTARLSGFSQAGGQENIILSGAVGSSYVVQVSANRTNWTPISTNKIPSGGSVAVAYATGSGQRFFQVVPAGSGAAPAPVLSGLTLGHGAASFVLTGPAGNSYVIQSSTDLVKWTPLSTNTVSAGGSVQIADLNPGSTRRFYRAASYAVIYPQMPTLTGLALSNGLFSFTLNGLSGHNYAIQTTEDLLNWTVIGDVTLGATGSFQFTDSNAGVNPAGFYRAVDTGS